MPNPCSPYKNENRENRFLTLNLSLFLSVRSPHAREDSHHVTRRIGSVVRPVSVDTVDRPHGLVSVAEAEDSHKLDFEFLASEPLARRLEAIAVNLNVASFLLVVKR